VIRESLERVLLGRGADWLGRAAGVAGDDLAGDGDLSDLVSTLLWEDEDAGELLRASRVPRVRPILVVLAARASGAAKVDPELQHAAELLYAALVLHDVALGGGGRRRIARKVLRRSVGWLGGNQLLMRAIELVRQVSSPEVLDELLDTVRAFAEGQQLASDLLAEGVPTRELWEEHADGHTAALFTFCCRAGALLSRREERQVAALGRYGRHLGRMWHVAEDVCLLLGPDGSEKLRKRAMTGRPMLVVAVAAERDDRVEALWRALVADPSPARAEVLLGLLHSTRAFTGTREAMVTESWSARAALRALEDDPYRTALERLASGLCHAPYQEIQAG
jgi:geranylgeranyl pyrophosphate synthase